MAPLDAPSELLNPDILQGSRLIRLTTPLGPDLLLAERLLLDEAVGPRGAPAAGFQAQVHALSNDAHLELKQLIGQPACLQLRLADGSLRGWHGHIEQAAQEGSDGGLARYHLTLQPWLAALEHRIDSWVFQDQTVPEIVEQVFADYLGRGRLAPVWRWDLADPGVYRPRSLCIQYEESDLHFVLRLLQEEGLFFWWEHKANPDSPALGLHTLVLADHNGACRSDLGPVRFTQAGAGLQEDSLRTWVACRRVATAQAQWASPDYRSLSLRPVQQTGVLVPAGLDALTLADVPGAYAYPDVEQGERLLLRQVQALDAHRHAYRASGTLRQAAPGSLFTLVDHSLHTGTQPGRDRFVILRAQLRARSNLPAGTRTPLPDGPAAVAVDGVTPIVHGPMANAGDEPVYHCALELQPVAVPVRQAAWRADGLPDVRLWPGPTVHGVQTAVVVGLESDGSATASPVFTDRDHRIRIQFHWQRGTQASHRLEGASGCNAPGTQAAGTWVRVAESLAGANWGSVFTPRVGQEVIVGFVGSCIDRPVILGGAYNGQGESDAQMNQVGGGVAGSTGNAPAWFPGQRSEGALQAHQHAAVLTGFKSQELASSGTGHGGHNQLVFDDSPGQARVEVSSTSAQTRLQLGHLLHQTDNRRLQARGHGVDLASQAWGAVRAAHGLLLSAQARTTGAMTLDVREPRARLDHSRALMHALSESAQQHGARLEAEPGVAGAGKADSGRQLPVERGLWATQDSLAGSESGGSSPQSGAADGITDAASGPGGGGHIDSFLKPDLLITAPLGIALQTPAAWPTMAAHTLSLVAGQDLQHTSQGHHAAVARQGAVLYTHGLASSPGRPIQEAGMRLHAAAGGVNLQSQTGAVHVAASQTLEVVSTQSMVHVSAPLHVLLAASGAALRVEGGDITLQGPGRVTFKASMKELGPGAAVHRDSVSLPRPSAFTSHLPGT